MADYITLTPSKSAWVVRAGGAVLAETSRAVELMEGGRGPVIYIPRDDVAMALFEPSPTRSTCPHKGEASYYSFMGERGTVRDAAWSYEAPKAGVEGIGGHLAFYPNKVTLERA